MATYMQYFAFFGVRSWNFFWGVKSDMALISQSSFVSKIDQVRQGFCDCISAVSSKYLFDELLAGLGSKICILKKIFGWRCDVEFNLVGKLRLPFKTHLM